MRLYRFCQSSPENTRSPWTINQIFPGAAGKKLVEEVGKYGRGGCFHNVPFWCIFESCEYVTYSKYFINLSILTLTCFITYITTKISIPISKIIVLVIFLFFNKSSLENVMLSITFLTLFTSTSLFKKLYEIIIAFPWQIV